MASDVSMTYSSLQAAANQVEHSKENLNEVISDLTKAVNALEGEWSGEAYNAFVEAWNESKPTMQKLADAVGRFAPELNEAVSTQQETEAKNASSMRSLAF